MEVEEEEYLLLKKIKVKSIHLNDDFLHDICPFQIWNEQMCNEHHVDMIVSEQNHGTLRPKIVLSSIKSFVTNGKSTLYLT